MGQFSGAQVQALRKVFLRHSGPNPAIPPLDPQAFQPLTVIFHLQIIRQDHGSSSARPSQSEISRQMRPRSTQSKRQGKVLEVAQQQRGAACLLFPAFQQRKTFLQEKSFGVLAFLCARCDGNASSCKRRVKRSAQSSYRVMARAHSPGQRMVMRACIRLKLGRQRRRTVQCKGA